MSAARRLVVMVCLCMSGAVIYLLPYSTEVYYKPLQTALDITNTEIGLLMSTLGIVNMLGYFPGGWLADRITPRKLLAFSLFATGLIGFYFATFPSYAMCFVVYAGWSLTSIFTFWAALIKATRDWGGSSEQGRAFGLLEGGRGVVRFVLASAGVAFMGAFADALAGFSAVVSLYSGFNVALAVAVWWALRDPAAEAPAASAPAGDPPAGDASAGDPPAGDASAGDASAGDAPAGDAPDEAPLSASGARALESSDEMPAGGREVFEVLKLPAVWLITVIIFAAYVMYLGSFYFTPYATDAFAMTVVMGGYLGAGKMILRPIGAAGAGFLGDAYASSRVVVVAFVVAFLSFGVFALMPSYSNLLQLDDVEDPAALAERLRRADGPVAAHLAGALPEGQRERLASGDALSPARVGYLVSALNEVLRREELYAPERFAGVELRPVTREHLPPEAAAGDDEDAEPRPEHELTLANRLLLEDAFPQAIARLPAERVREGAPTAMLVLLLVNVAAATLCLYALRGLYYALLQEGGVPRRLTGTATGVVSVLGYTPDIFFPPLIGFLLDRYPGGVGYQYAYAFVGVLCLGGLAASVAFVRRYGGRRTGTDG